MTKGKTAPNFIFVKRTTPLKGHGIDVAILAQTLAQVTGRSKDTFLHKIRTLDVQNTRSRIRLAYAKWALTNPDVALAYNRAIENVK